jgi:DNA-binding winged helix-turn-helix (wHTH) protein
MYLKTRDLFIDIPPGLCLIPFIFVLYLSQIPHSVLLCAPTLERHFDAGALGRKPRQACYCGEVGSENRAPKMHLPSSPDSIICFGIFELNLEARELRKRGLQVKLTQQAFRLLAALVETAGEIKTRDELRKKLWPSNTYVDFEHSLNKAIHCLREALGDSAINPRFIETVPGRGYRFVPVAHKRNEIRVEKKTLESLAVVPFTFVSGPEAESTFIAAQLTATLINVLSRESKVRVLAYNTVRHYNSDGKSPANMAADLRVKSVLVGEVFERNAEVLIHVELIDTSDGAQLCGVHLKRSPLNFSEEIEKIAVELSNKILTALAGRVESARLKRHSDLSDGPPVPIAARVLSKAWIF